MRLPDPSRSRVVLFGTGVYASPELRDEPAVARNIHGLRRLLTSEHGTGIDPANCVVVPPAADQRAVGRHLVKAAREAEDMLLVYYSGHGLIGRRSGELYLTLADTEPDELAYSALRYEAVREACLESAAAIRVVILDCCYSGRAIGEHLSADTDAVLEQVRVDGTFTLTSAPSNRTAVVLPGEQYTAFTGRLIRLLSEGIPGGPPLLSLDAIYRSLRAKLRSESLPEPRHCGTETSDQLALAKNPALAPVRLPQPGPPPWARRASPPAARPAPAVGVVRLSRIPASDSTDPSGPPAVDDDQPTVEIRPRRAWAAAPAPMRRPLRTPRAAAAARLVFTDGRVHPLRNGSTVVGRGDQVTLRIPDVGVSRRHARFDVDGGRVVLTDLGSVHGTTVNGRRITVVELATGDVVQLGTTTLTFRWD